LNPTRLFDQYVLPRRGRRLRNRSELIVRHRHDYDVDLGMRGRLPPVRYRLCAGKLHPASQHTRM